jgi:hypothetical protein
VQFSLIRNGKSLKRNASIILNAVTLDGEMEAIKDTPVSLTFRLRCLVRTLIDLTRSSNINIE